jgi:hypothetical protein
MIMAKAISRRTALAGLSLGVASAAAAQTPATPAEEKQQKADADLKETKDKLAQLKVPIDLEPAVTFHV